MAVWVLTGRQASAGDQSAIRRGVPSFDLMRAAGERAADVILRRHPGEAAHGVAVFTGSGNNGGDGYIVARALAQKGIPVSHTSVLEPRTEDARRARQQFLESAGASAQADPGGRSGVVVDAVLGTGSSGTPRDEVRTALDTLRNARLNGHRVVALDLPSGVPSDDEAQWETVRADTTVAFGSIKRGHLLNRSRCGEIQVVDIGLVDADMAGDDRAQLIDSPWIRAHTPRIPAQGHKGMRGKLVILGGDVGMAGAVALAARAALRSGIGLVHCCVHPQSVAVVQTLVPAATASAWPVAPDDPFSWSSWADAILVGPGLGRARAQRALVGRALQESNLPVVIDADGLTNFAGDVQRLAAHLKLRPGVITPHAGEAAALVGLSAATVMAERFSVAPAMAASLGTCVLLKGAPTLVAAPDAPMRVSARGNAALATGGTGDVLGGIIATLLAQGAAPAHAAAIGAFVHGRAAEVLVPAPRGVRGVSVDDVVDALPLVWQERDEPDAPGVIARLPGLPDE